jgi:hypothetical protein
MLSPQVAQLRSSGLSGQLLILVLLGLALACGEHEEPLDGFGLVPDLVDSAGLRTVVLPASDLDTYFQATRNAGSRYWVGRELEPGGTAEAKALLRVRMDVPAGASVVSATLRLPCDQEGDYGDTLSVQAVEVHQVDSGSWYTDLAQGWPFDLHRRLDPPAGFEVGECDNDSVLVALPAGLVATWIAFPDSNHGLALVAGEGSAFKRFRVDATLTQGATSLSVRYTVGTDTTITLVRLALSDHATLTSLSPQVENGTGGESFALVGGPYDFRGVVRFDLSSLPAGASLNILKLTLHLDPAQALASEDTALAIGLHEVVTLPGEDLKPRPPVVFVSAAARLVTVDAIADTTLSVEISSLGRAVERGILLRAERDFPFLARIGFGTREGASALRPSLEVTYSLPGRIRL